MEHLQPLLESARVIELIDWPHPDVPATLIRAGYSVVGHEPDGFKTYMIVSDEPPGRTFPITGGGFLTSEPLDALPDVVDVVNTFRPADEQPDIARGVIDIGAKALWIQPGESTSDSAREIIEDAGLVFVCDVDIAVAGAELGIEVEGRS